MGSTQKNCNEEIPLSTWRQMVVIKILKLDPTKIPISRAVQFLAVSILDKYLANATEKKVLNDFSMGSVMPTCFALVSLACKFHFGRSPKNVTLMKYFDYSGNCDAIKRAWRMEQTEIYKAISFQIPLWTAFQILQSIETESDNERISQFKALKILVFGMLYSSEISMHPDFGARIFHKIHNRSKDDTIVQYLKRFMPWYSSQRNKIVLF